MNELIGNEKPRNQFKNFIEHNQSNNKPIFLILIGQEGIGKTTFLHNFVEDNLGEYVKIDFFRMRDCTRQLGKNHSIQVETPDKQKTIAISENEIYDNKGIRELNTWLQQSSVSGKKIVIIENLQRMTNSAMNAFLKTCEEPLPNRYILATAEHESGVLPTILSRAMIIKFSALTDLQMKEYVDREYPNLNTEDKNMIAELSMGSPGVFHDIYLQLQKDGEILTNIKTLLSLMKSKGMRTKKMQLFKNLEEKGLLEMVQNVLIKEYMEEGNTRGVDIWIKVKQLVSANVSQENALRNAILEMEE